MKKIVALLLALGMTFVLSACGGAPQDNRVVTGYDIDVPEGFEETEMEGIERYYIHEDGSNINMTVVEKTGMDDASFDEITVEMLRETLEEGFLSAYDLEVTIAEDSLTRDPVSDFPAYQYTCSYELGGVTLEQLIVCINADQVYTITYTDASGSWMETFRTSAQNIQLTTQEQ